MKVSQGSFLIASVWVVIALMADTLFVTAAASGMAFAWGIVSLLQEAHEARDD